MTFFYKKNSPITFFIQLGIKKSQEGKKIESKLVKIQLMNAIAIKSWFLRLYWIRNKLPQKAIEESIIISSRMEF